MSQFIRPTIAVAIVFGCLAALVPRIILPMLRSKPTPSESGKDFRRMVPTTSMPSRNPNTAEKSISSSESSEYEVHMKNPYMYHQSLDPEQQVTLQPMGHKSTSTVPMYAVGLIVFLLYTCCKYWSRANQREAKLQQRYTSKNIRWNANNYRFKYEIDDSGPMDDHEIEDDRYSGLDPDYVEYLKSKRYKELEAERRMTVEQKQMNSTLESMKSSFSYINKKLASNESGENLSQDELNQLQERLAFTEAQMCQILSALDAASSKVQELSRTTRGSLLTQSDQNTMDDGPTRLFSRSSIESDGGELDDDDEESESDDDSENPDDSANVPEQKPSEEDESGSSSSEDEDGEFSPDEQDDPDDQSETSSGRYGIMETNYGCDSADVDDFDLVGTATVSNPPQDSRAKVQEWRQRNNSQSLSSSHSSLAEDQTTPDSAPIQGTE